MSNRNFAKGLTLIAHNLSKIRLFRAKSHCSTVRGGLYTISVNRHGDLLRKMGKKIRNMGLSQIADQLYCCLYKHVVVFIGRHMRQVPDGYSNWLGGVLCRQWMGCYRRVVHT